MNWKLKAFEQLSVHELYNLLKIRSEVFVVEQECIYQDLDDLDQKCLHLFLEDEGKILACSRLIPPEVKFEEAGIGRVIVAPQVRKHGYGNQLLEKALESIEGEWGKVPVKIGAQAHLTKFYGALGFRVISDVYLEDGIPHVTMLKN